MRVFVPSILLLAACLSCGGPDASVQGTVTIDGQLARGGTVQFHPVEGGPTAYGSIARDGSYSLRVGQGDLSDPNAGAVPLGKYIVTVVVNMPSAKDETVGESGPPRPGARLTAEKYANKETSELQFTVKSGRNVIPLELEGAAADELATELESSEAKAATQPESEIGQESAVDPPDQGGTDIAAPPSADALPQAVPEVDTPLESSEPPASVEEPTQ
jgi:hypothetical protein